MFGIAFVFIAALQSAQASPADIKDALSYADALYYSAHFSESIAVLTKVNDAIRTEKDLQREKIDTKLRLALSYIGMNENAKAKSSLLELFALDPDYALDEHEFSAKVVSVAGEAKAELAKVRCYDAQMEARTYVDNGETTKFLDLLASMGEKCTVLAALAPQAAEMAFQRGSKAYKAGAYSTALSSFEEALTLSPEHDLAHEYADLTRSRLDLQRTTSTPR